MPCLRPQAGKDHGTGLPGVRGAGVQRLGPVIRNRRFPPDVASRAIEFVLENRARRSLSSGRGVERARADLTRTVWNLERAVGSARHRRRRYRLSPGFATGEWMPGAPSRAIPGPALVAYLALHYREPPAGTPPLDRSEYQQRRR